MKFILIAALFAAAAPLGAQGAGKRPPVLEKRVATVEKRVNSVEKRVTKLEGGTSPAQPKTALQANPIEAVFIKKKQIVSQEKIGVKLYVEFENISNRRLFAFNGTLVFRDETGAVIWSRAYGYSEPIGPGDKAQAELAVTSERTKEYLKLVKARGITVSLEKQEAYGAE